MLFEGSEFETKWFKIEDREWEQEQFLKGTKLRFTRCSQARVVVGTSVGPRRVHAAFNRAGLWKLAERTEDDWCLLQNGAFSCAHRLTRLPAVNKSPGPSWHCRAVQAGVSLWGQLDHFLILDENQETEETIEEGRGAELQGDEKEQPIGRSCQFQILDLWKKVVDILWG